MTDPLNITPEEALKFLQDVVKRVDDKNCETDGVCPLDYYCTGREICTDLYHALVKE